MLKLYITRYIGCAVSLAVCCALFDTELTAALFGWAALLALLYTLVKPLYSLLALPLDVFLSGLGTLLLDALIVNAVVPYDFAYWQALAAAALIALLFTPYERVRAQG